MGVLKSTKWIMRKSFETVSVNFQIVIYTHKGPAQR
jgi:hypothetical protein